MPRCRRGRRGRRRRRRSTTRRPRCADERRPRHPPAVAVVLPADRWRSGCRSSATRAVFQNPWLAIPGVLVLAVRHLRLGASSPATASQELTIEQTTEVAQRRTAAPRRPRDARPRRTARTTRTTGVTNTEAGDVAVPVVGLPVLRRVHLDVPAVPRPRRPDGPDAEGRLQHPVHVGDVVHPADELAHDGARARGDPAGRPPPVPDLARSPPRCSARRSSPARSSSSPSSTARASTLDTNLFGSSFFVLTGFHGAHVTVGIIWLLSLWGLSMQGRLAAAALRAGRDRRPLLALRRHRLDRDLHRHLPDPAARLAAMTTAAEERRATHRGRRSSASRSEVDGPSRRARSATARAARACCRASSGRTRRRSST